MKISCDFLKKINIFGEIWYQIYILWLIFFPKMYTLIYAMVKVQKLTVVDKF